MSLPAAPLSTCNRRAASRAPAGWTDLDTVLLFPDPVEFILLPPSLNRLLFWSAARPKLHTYIDKHAEKLAQGKKKGSWKCTGNSSNYLQWRYDGMWWFFFFFVKVYSPGFSFIVGRQKVVGWKRKKDRFLHYFQYQTDRRNVFQVNGSKILQANVRKSRWKLVIKKKKKNPKKIQLVHPWKLWNCEELTCKGFFSLLQSSWQSLGYVGKSGNRAHRELSKALFGFFSEGILRTTLSRRQWEKLLTMFVRHEGLILHHTVCLS